MSTAVRARNSREIAVILGLVDPPKTHSLKAVEAGIRKYYGEHGRVPFLEAGDATSYVRYRATWKAVSLWLRKKGHGSLAKLCKKMGFDPYHAPHNLKDIKTGIRGYYEEHGKVPAQTSGDATPYIGYRANWLAVSSWLSNKGHGSLHQLCKKMGLDTFYAPHSLKAIKAGVRKHYKEHGKTPNRGSEDATPYVGYKTTWLAVSAWLRKKGHGSLSQLCQEMGFDSCYAPHSIKAIKAGVRKFHKEHSKPPPRSLGDATSYVGYPTTWEAISQWLKSHGHGSLSKFCKKMGFDPYYASHTIESIRSGVQRYYEEHGKVPTRKSGDATPYVGYKTTWATVSQWLKSHGHGSLPKLCKKMGFDTGRAPHNLKVINTGIQRFHKEHGKVPSQNSGDATPYVGYPTNWNAVNSWLTSHGHGSLSKLCKKMGFDTYHATHNLKKITAGIRKFHKEHGKVPVQKSGDATPYVGYKATWSVADQWVRNNGHGSLLTLCKKMGFDTFYAPHSLKAIKTGIRKFHKECVRTPSEGSGDATSYVGYKTTWATVNGWLRKKGHGSLPKLCKKMGLKPLHAPHTLKNIKSGIQRFHKEHGEAPGQLSGDAEPYVGYKANWGAVNSWLRNNGHGSLHQLCKEMGLK